MSGTPIIIPYARDYYVSTGGSCIRDVVCEECKTPYCYSLFRIGMGLGTSVLFLDNQGAQNRANRRAAENLQISLRNEHDPVACPKCQHVQSEMRKQVMKVVAERRLVSLLGMWFFLAVAFAIAMFFQEVNFDIWKYFMIANGAFSLMVIGLWLWWRRSDTASFRRLNKDAPELLAPPALVVDPSQPPSLAPANRIECKLSKGGIVIQGPQLIPQICLYCLDATDHTHRVPINLPFPQDPLPCCKKCSQVMTWKAWKTYFAIWSLISGCGYGCLAATRLDEFNRMGGVLLIATAVAPILALAIGNRWSQVVTIRDIDTHRGWFSLHPRNKTVTEFLMRWYCDPERYRVAPGE